MQELTFKDIIKTLLPKLKMLLVILLIGAVVGGCVGVARTYAARSYGTTIEFYINPKLDEDITDNQSQYGVYGAYGWHVMQNITKLLESEAFAENMLIGEDGLPIESVLAKEADRTEIDKRIASARAAMQEAADAQTALDNATDEERDAAEKLVLEKLAAVTAETERVFEYWRDSEVYAEYITMITNSVSYTFYNDTDIQMNSTEALAKSFIYCDISAAQSEEMARFMYDRINEVLPRFVEDKMPVPSGYVGTNCQRITRLDEIKQTDSGALFSTAVKYALLLGVLAFVFGAVCIIVLDRSKKWYQANKMDFTGTDNVSLGDESVETPNDASSKNDGAVDWQ